MSDTGPLDSTYGALYIGVLIATFFQGILTIQAYVYYESFPDDSWRLKALVGGVWLVDLVHLILIGQATYHYLVTEWGNPNSLPFSIWSFDAHLIPLGISTIMCQAFFLWRIWLFSAKSVLLIVALSSLCLTTFALDIYMAVQDIRMVVVSEFQTLAPEVTATFSTGAASDVCIALLLCYYLRRGGSGFEKTNSIISHLIRYTVTTGLATSMLAVACLIAYFARPNTFIFIAMHFSLGRMYTNALIATLNSRRTLRRNNGDHTSIPRTTVSVKGPRTSTQMISREVPVGYKAGALPLAIENIRSSQIYAASHYSFQKNQGRESDEIELQTVKESFRAHQDSSFAV